MGLAVGLAVGPLVGLSVGFAVGLVVGLVVGLAVARTGSWSSSSVSGRSGDGYLIRGFCVMSDVPLGSFYIEHLPYMINYEVTR